MEFIYNGGGEFNDHKKKLRLLMNSPSENGVFIQIPRLNAIRNKICNIIGFYINVFFLSFFFWYFKQSQFVIIN